jgi:Na+/proline symporter
MDTSDLQQKKKLVNIKRVSIIAFLAVILAVNAILAGIPDLYQYPYQYALAENIMGPLLLLTLILTYSVLPCLLLILLVWAICWAVYLFFKWAFQ